MDEKEAIHKKKGTRRRGAEVESTEEGGENCIYGTPNNALRKYRTSIVVFVKITLQILSSCFP